MCKRTHLTILLLAAAGLPLVTGCTTVPAWTTHLPLFPAEKTTYSTPRLRIDAVRDYGAQATGVDSPEQREITEQLARQIQIEPDPLVRETIVLTIGEFNTPLAQQVLQAGVNDEELSVRIKCCQMLGERGDPAAVETLATLLRDETDIDVRLAAAEALGSMHTPEAVQALAITLEDRDPALQFVGVNSLKSITGQDFDGDVRTWRQYVAGDMQTLPDQPEISVAERVREALPF